MFLDPVRFCLKEPKSGRIIFRQKFLKGIAAAIRLIQ
jgi:hypothetical protein